MNTKFATLHEAIIHILDNAGSATFEEIANIIEQENLWQRKSDGKYPKSFQIKLRTTVQKRYKNLFQKIGIDKVSLKN